MKKSWFFITEATEDYRVRRCLEISWVFEGTEVTEVTEVPNCAIPAPSNRDNRSY